MPLNRRPAIKLYDMNLADKTGENRGLVIVKYLPASLSDPSYRSELPLRVRLPIVPVDLPNTRVSNAGEFVIRIGFCSVGFMIGLGFVISSTI